MKSLGKCQTIQNVIKNIDLRFIDQNITEDLPAFYQSHGKCA